jgi:hypothetical protein
MIKMQLQIEKKGFFLQFHPFLKAALLADSRRFFKNFVEIVERPFFLNY